MNEVQTEPSLSVNLALITKVQDHDWNAVEASLDEQGFAVLENILSHAQCRQVAELYPQEDYFRKKVVMQSHGFGRGEYQYFSYPLPALVESLRTIVYPKLAPIANRWNSSMNIAAQFPPVHAQFKSVCHDAGQDKPTPLLLQYGPEDYNCLHQDLYGEHVFPLQMAILLSKPNDDFQGGEFVMTEQRPRMQSRPMVVPLTQGDAVIFAVNNRPVQGARGTYKVNLRHGVSKVLSGHRHTLGIIFHDAK